MKSIPRFFLSASSLILSSMLFTSPQLAQNIIPSIRGMKCEYKSNPLGIDSARPRLSWQVAGAPRSWIQTAYQIRVGQNPATLAQGMDVTWDSGKVSSPESAHRIYGGPALQAAKKYYWQVRSWDGADKPTAWSDAAWWEMGLLQPADWKAEWIEPGIAEDTGKSNPAILLRRELELKSEVQSARAYVTSRGLYEMHVNGQRIGNEVLTPGWTAYDHHIQYQIYDISSQVRKGKNAVGITLGDGWYRGNLAFSGQRNTYGSRLALLLQIAVTYADGTGQVFSSDSNWKCSTGPILMSDIYNGETYDARLEKKGWSAVGFDDSAWQGVKTTDYPKNNLVAPAGPPIRKIQEWKPVKLIKTPAGETVIDMGQNMVGWVRLKVRGPAGKTVTLKHAEVLDKAGNFYVENLRAARQTIAYTLSGNGDEVYEPHFTFQGFRYVQVEGFPGEPGLDSITGVVVHSDITLSGTFECSEPMINQLQHNIQWGQKGNFVDVPTDCPQRDERLGWTGDAQAFARTASFNADVAAFYTKWLKDMAADQKPSGAIPDVIPNVLNRKDPARNSASAGWADAAVIVPWTVYLNYGDTRILEQQYDSMKKWVDYIANRAGNSYLWNNDFAYGDWLAFATNRSDYPGATTDKDLIQQAYFARSTDLLQKTASILGKTDDSAKYAELLGKVKRAFQGEFMTPNGRLSSNTQTAYSLALSFGLMPENLRPQAAERLAADVRKFKHITTGFLGAPLICQVLSDFGFFDEAFMLLHRKEYPSWLYPITKGATTIWERWDGIKPDGSFQDKGMNSFNHYAYGAIGEWMYRFIAGIEIDAAKPGYKHAIIQPHAGGGLTYARASHETLYGRLSSAWELKEGRMSVAVEIPANTTATVRLHQAKLTEVLESGQPAPKAAGIQHSVQEENFTVLEVGSGKYLFSYPALSR